jgi:hypothetical protein
MDFLEYSDLAQAIDTTFGRSSTTGIASHSIKASIIGQDQVRVVYACVVNLTTDREALQMKQRYSDESDDIIRKYIAKMKADYKAISGQTISFKETSSNVSLEMVNMNIFNRKRTAIFRRLVLLDVT